MQNELEVKTIPFLGTELMAARDEEGKIWAGVRWLCDGIGLSRGQRDRQIANIQEDKVLSKGAANLRLPTNGGVQSIQCLALDFLPLWLAKISITPNMEAEAPALAANLEEYQLRAKDVLAAAFLPKEHQEPKSAMALLRLQSQALFELDERVDVLEDKLDHQMTIDHNQQLTLSGVVGKRVYERLAEAIPAREISEKKGRFFRAIYHDLKTRFGVASYLDIRPTDYPDAVAYAENWIEPAALRRPNQ